MTIQFPNFIIYGHLLLNLDEEIDQIPFQGHYGSKIKVGSKEPKIEMLTIMET